MKRTDEDLVSIKKSKSVLMLGNNRIVRIMLIKNGFVQADIDIPMEKAFQIKRGLETYIQRFYRRK